MIHKAAYGFRVKQGLAENRHILLVKQQCAQSMETYLIANAW